MICFGQTPVSGTPPSSRSGHSAVALGESLVVYGGMNGQDGVTFNDIFELRTGELALMPPFNIAMPPTAIAAYHDDVAQKSQQHAPQRTCISTCSVV